MKQSHFEKDYGGNAPANYEKYFVPVIGKPLADDLVESAHISHNEMVLDVACGTGIVARLAAGQTGENVRVDGLDLNHGMLEVARALTKNEKRFAWHEASAEAMPMPGNTYDVVICQMGLQFMEDKPAALKEMYRVLKPGGRLVLNVPGPAAPLFRMMDKGLEKHISPQAAGFVNTVFSLYEPGEIEALLKNAGFDDVHTKHNSKEFHLPQPKEFLWQYISSTPLSGIVKETEDINKAALEEELIKEWNPFVAAGEMVYEQEITEATAVKRK